MDQRLVSFQLRPGAEDPGPGNWKAKSWIPPGTRTGLVATFNGGFKINTSGGGFYLNGDTAGTLTNGAASVVYYRNGTIKIGVWGRDVRMTSNVVGVRQNLKLIVDHGRVPAAVNQDVAGQLGRHPGRRLLRLALGPGRHQGRPGHLRLRPGAQRPGTRRPAAAGGRGRGPAAGHQPVLDVLRVLQDRRPPVGPEAGRTCCPPSSDRLPVLLGLQPRLHRGLRPVTAEASAAEETAEPGGARNAAARPPAELARRGAAHGPAPPVAEEPAGLRGPAGRRDLGPAPRGALRTGRRGRLRLRVGRGVLHQRRRRRRARSPPSAQAVPPGGGRRPAEVARGGHRCDLRRGRPERGPGRLGPAAHRGGRRLPGHLVPVLVRAQAHPGGRADLRGVRLPAPRARRRGGHARAAVGLVPGGVQPGRARGGHRQALHRAGRPRPGRDPPPPGAALVPAVGAAGRPVDRSAPR